MTKLLTALILSLISAVAGAQDSHRWNEVEGGLWSPSHFLVALMDSQIDALILATATKENKTTPPLIAIPFNTKVNKPVRKKPLKSMLIAMFHRILIRAITGISLLMVAVVFLRLYLMPHHTHLANFAFMGRGNSLHETIPILKNPLFNPYSPL